jgi:tetratricopeptide (TPR) repeat protein
MNAMFFLQKGDQILARQNAENAVKSSVEVGVPMLEAWSRVAFAYALRRQGERRAARDQLAMAEKMVAPAGITHVLYLIRLTQASLYFDEGNNKRGNEALREAFRIGSDKGYGMTLYWYWQPDEMARLCTEALHGGKEVEYAMELITKCRLKPTAPPERLLDWPIPYRVKTLGCFEILVNEKPLTFSRKVQKKPLALLKSLIAFGGRDVREETIEDELWPEADGDIARITLKTTLSRLRHLLGSERVIDVRDGKISLNTQQVWIDTWAVESLAKRVSKLWDERRQGSSPAEIEELAMLLAELYRGEFLPGEDGLWTDSIRERLRNSFLKTLEKLAHMLDELGEKEKAISLYEKAIERGISPKDIHFQTKML